MYYTNKHIRYLYRIYVNCIIITKCQCQRTQVSAKPKKKSKKSYWFSNSNHYHSFIGWQSLGSVFFRAQRKTKKIDFIRIVIEDRVGDGYTFELIPWWKKMKWKKKIFKKSKKKKTKKRKKKPENLIRFHSATLC